MAEKEIKKITAAPQAVGSRYTIREFEDASTRVFGVPRECAVAAFRECGKTEMTVEEAKQIIDKFMKKEVR